MNNDNKKEDKVESVESKVDEQTKSADKQPTKKQQPLSRQFELQVFDEDLNDDGTIKLKPVRYDQAVIVEASSKQQLNDILVQYRACGQVAKVVREVTPPEILKEMMAKKTELDNTVAAVVNQPKHNNTSEVKMMQKEEKLVDEKPTSKTKPKIVTIGDMQVKYDGEHVYQKQWVKLNVNEASNFRVVSDSSNKIVSLTGKHIEARRWILVEETKDDETSNDAIESLILGN